MIPSPSRIPSKPGAMRSGRAELRVRQIADADEMIELARRSETKSPMVCMDVDDLQFRNPRIEAGRIDQAEKTVCWLSWEYMSMHASPVPPPPGRRVRWSQAFVALTWSAASCFSRRDGMGRGICYLADRLFPVIWLQMFGPSWRRSR